jgi:ATP-binding cassette subfamily B protein
MKTLKSGNRSSFCASRASCSPPSDLILDEATSNIDTKTDLQLQKRLTADGGRTTFIVAHRLST